MAVLLLMVQCLALVVMGHFGVGGNIATRLMLRRWGFHGVLIIVPFMEHMQ